MADTKKGLTKLIQWWGTKCNKVTIEVNEDYVLEYTDTCECIKKNGENTTLRHPFQIQEVIDFLCDDIRDLRSTLDDSIDVNDPYINRYNLNFDFDSNKFIVNVQYSFNSEGEEMIDVRSVEENENIIEIFNDLERNGARGICQVDFNGSGDSGYIEDSLLDSNGRRLQVPTELENELYDFLENEHGGWENNEGSFGQFMINLPKKEIELYYTENFEEQEEAVIYESSIDELIDEINSKDDVD
jgi:hypothetical protein